MDEKIIIDEEKYFTEKQANQHVDKFITDLLMQKFGFVQNPKNKKYLVRVREHYIDAVLSQPMSGGRRRKIISVIPIYNYSNTTFLSNTTLAPREYRHNSKYRSGAWYNIGIDQRGGYIYPIEELEKVCEKGIAPYVEYEMVGLFNSISFNGDTKYTFCELSKMGWMDRDEERYIRLSSFHKGNMKFAQLYNNLILGNFEGAEQELVECLEKEVSDLKRLTERGNEEKFIKDIGLEKNIETMQELQKILKEKKGDWQKAIKDKIAMVEDDVLKNVWGVTLDEEGNTIKYKKPRKKKGE